MVLVNNYFVSKKKNIKDLDPDENDGYIISKLQLEWAHRLYNMNEYYMDIVNSYSESIETKVAKKSLMSSIVKSISYYLSEPDTNHSGYMSIRNV